jgi:ribosome recycling factor
MAYLNRISLLFFSTKPSAHIDTAQLLKKFKDSLKQISSAAKGSSLLEGFNIKLSGSKGTTIRLSEIGKLNVIDSYKAEITTFDPQVLIIIRYIILTFIR